MILTDQKGLYSADPRKDPGGDAGRRGPRRAIPRSRRMAGGAGSALGSGGMLTKVLAAKRAARSGAHTAIAWGREPDVLTRLFAGEAIGTLLVARRRAPVAARKQWLADHLKPSGRIVLDAGAVKALRGRRQEPAAPSAPRRCEGAFERGEVVSVVGPDGREIARGLVNYGVRRDRAHPAQAHLRDRVRPGLPRRARADPQGQPGRTMMRVPIYGTP